MKRSNVKALLILLVLTIVGCAKSDIATNQIDSNESFSLKVTAPAETKVSIDGTSIEWSTDDKLYIIPVSSSSIDTMYLLTIDPSTISDDGKDAEFSGKCSPELGDYIAVTGADVVVDKTTGKVSVSRSTLTQSGSNDATHLESDWFMLSNTFEIDGTNTPSILFENMQSVLALKIKMGSTASSQEIASLTFSAEQSSFSTVSLIDSDGDVESSLFDSEVTLQFSPSASISASNEYTALVPIVWNEGISEVTGDFTVTIKNSNGGVMSVSFDARELTSGKYYTASLEFSDPLTQSEIERNALIAFYNATGGDDWTYNMNWCSDADLSEWGGVTTDEEGNVTELNLIANNLIGEIPSEIGDLSNLKELYLMVNELGGNIPVELGLLTNLEKLYLNFCQLSGEIPAEIGELSNLTYLFLSDNQLTGEIPSEIGNMKSLTILNLVNNQLTGEIPAELANLSNLRSLTLYSNQLTGEIPSELGNLSNLEGLSLYDNQLSGDIPQTIIDHIYFNLFTLTPQQDGYGFDNTSFSEEEREVLIALYNATDGDNWTYNTNWCSEESIDQWEGIVVNGLGKVSSINLFNNNLTGTIPSELGNLSSLYALNLYYNQLTGDIPTELGELSNLAYLYLYGNELTGSIPTEIGNLSKLEWLGLFNNQLTGEIPTELGNLSNLESLTLNNNQLTGSIPTELGKLDNVTTLSLNDNNLSGTIPAELANISSLTNLRLTNNQLSGDLPSALKNHANYSYFWINPQQDGYEVNLDVE